MAGIMLYSITLVLELISVVVRFALVSGVVSLFAGGEVGIGMGLIAGLGPIIHSLLVVAGIPSGHILIYRSIGARPLSRTEHEKLEAVLAPLRDRGVTCPTHIYALDTEGLNAAIAGRTLYIHRELFASRYLAGVIAHELGHFNSMDGRLLLGIRALTIPGGFFIAYILLGVLRWVAYGISTILVALLVVLFAFLRINLSGITGPLFGITIHIVRMAVIFAVGGVGPALFGSIWRSYFIEREFAADGFAGRLGYAYDLIDFFETEVLSDVVIPWYEQPTHPTATRRVANLEQIAAHFPQQQARHVGKKAAYPVVSAHEVAATRPSAMAAASPLAPTRRPPRSPWLIVAGAGLLTVVLLVGVFLTYTPTHYPADSIQPTPGPTPTLGLPPIRSNAPPTMRSNQPANSLFTPGKSGMAAVPLA